MNLKLPALNKKSKILISLLILIPVILLIVLFINQMQLINRIVKEKDQTTTPVTSYPLSSPVSSTVKGDFSCQPNECEAQLNSGINSVAYPSCNPKVQINNTATADPNSCSYWRNQQKYFGTEDYVNLSELSKQSKSANGDSVIDGFLGLDDHIQIHRKAAPIFLKAEAEFNRKYGANRVGSTYYLPSYPNGYTFSFSGSLFKREIRGSLENKDGLLYQGQYITPSNHFWGVAIDLNSSTNEGNRVGANQCNMDIPPELVSVFEANGLRWGGRYSNDDHTLMDPMHFELIPDCVEPGLVNL